MTENVFYVAYSPHPLISPVRIRLLEAMRTGLFVERISRRDGERPWPEDVLEWGTRNGADALGWGGEVGSLEVGDLGL